MVRYPPRSVRSQVALRCVYISSHEPPTQIVKPQTRCIHFLLQFPTISVLPQIFRHKLIVRSRTARLDHSLSHKNFLIPFIPLLTSHLLSRTQIPFQRLTCTASLTGEVVNQKHSILSTSGGPLLWAESPGSDSVLALGVFGTRTGANTIQYLMSTL